MIRSIAILCLLAAEVAAQPAPAQRKQAPTADKFTKAASEAFAEAVEADEKGDLYRALTAYQKAFLIAPHPSTMFNIADVQRRLSLIPGAIKSYETYLALAPQARDRPAVEAMVAKLEKTPTTIHIKMGDTHRVDSIDLRTAYILIDGKIEAKPGTEPRKLPNGDFAITFDVPPGEHVIDVITAITYGTDRCGSGPGEADYCTVTARPRIDGQLVLSARDRRIEILDTPKARSSTYNRVDLRPGRHRLLVRDRRFECAPLVVDVPRGDDVAYVFLNTTEYEFERCRKLDVVRQRLPFAP